MPSDEITVGSKWLNKKEGKEYEVVKYLADSDWPIQLHTDWICSVDYFLENFSPVVVPPKAEKCCWCNGSGIVAGPGEYTIDECGGCKGTGLKQPELRVGAKVRIRSSSDLFGVVERIEEYPILVRGLGTVGCWYKDSELEVIG